MPLSRAEIDAWATAYIKVQQDPEGVSGDHPLWWAIEKFMPVLGNEAADPEDSWVAILEILSRSPTDTVIGMLAAGPLQDLIEYHGNQFIDRIELESRCNPAFWELLGGVWKSGPDEVWTRVTQARGNAW